MRTAFAVSMCAGIRAARSMNRYIQRIEEIMRQNRKLKPVLITLTVKNGEDLQNALSTLQAHLRRFYSVTVIFKKKGRGFNQFCKIDGGFIRLNTPLTTRPINGIRIFIFSHC